tara:strand:- start:171 stop:338 length:168 start_codon:yes stop_codon:yes gene_type:complete
MENIKLLLQSMKIIVPVIILGLLLMLGGLYAPFLTGIIVMVTSVGGLIWSRKFFE